MSENGSVGRTTIGRGSRRWPWILVAVVALVAGGVGGFYLRPVVAPQVVVLPPPPPIVQIVPGAPCSAATDAAAAIQTQLQDAVTAIRNFDPRGLQRILDELQRQQLRLRQALDSCQQGSRPTLPTGIPRPGG